VIRKSTVFDDDITYPADKYRLGPGDEITMYIKTDLESEDKDYRIGESDKLDIRFYSHPELSMVTTVLPDGNIVVPPLGPIQAKDKKPHELAKDMEMSFSEIVREPQIFVVPLSFYSETENLAQMFQREAKTGIPLIVQPNGTMVIPFVDTLSVMGMEFKKLDEQVHSLYAERFPGIATTLFLSKPLNNNVYILGEVRQAGSYSLDGVRTLSQLLAKAQVSTDNAAMNSIVVLSRTPDGKPEEKIVNISNLLSKGNISEDVPLRQYDVVFVPKKGIVKVGLFVKQYIDDVIPDIFRIGIGLNDFENLQ